MPGAFISCKCKSFKLFLFSFINEEKWSFEIQRLTGPDTQYLLQKACSKVSLIYNIEH